MVLGFQRRRRQPRELRVWKRCLTDEAHTVSGLGIDEG